MKKMFYAILVALIVVTTVSSCKKDKKNTTTNIPPAGALQLWPNVHIIDSTQWILAVNSQTPGDGFYRYTFTPSTPTINVAKGDIIIGASNGGYIRKITSITIAGAYYVLGTTQATMADVFKSGSFNFQIPVNDPLQGTPGVTRAFSNFRIAHTPNFSLTLQNGQFNIQPTCDFSFAFDSVVGLTNFQIQANNTSASENVRYNLKGVMPVLLNTDTVLGTFSMNSIQTVQAWTAAGNVTVPIPVKLSVSYSAKATIGAPHGDTINTTLTWATTDVFSGGLQYQGGAWQSTHSSAATNTVAFDTLTNSYNSNAQLTFATKISSSFYTIGGPQISTGIGGDFTQLQQGATAPFHHRTDAWSVATDAQIVTPIIGHAVPPFTQSWTSDTVFYQAPYLLTKVSGDNDSALVVHALPAPLVVKVTDSNGQPVVNVAVAFAVTHGGGTLSAYNLITDVNGLAQVTWTLGPPMGNQNVTVNAYDGNRHPLNGAPAVFNAIGY